MAHRCSFSIFTAVSFLVCTLSLMYRYKKKYIGVRSGQEQGYFGGLHCSTRSSQKIIRPACSFPNSIRKAAFIRPHYLYWYHVPLMNFNIFHLQWFKMRYTLNLRMLSSRLEWLTAVWDIWMIYQHSFVADEDRRRFSSFGTSMKILNSFIRF